MNVFKTKKQAYEIAVSLSRPSKMPCKGYSLPASECKVGSQLRNICGSVCEKCYAYERGNYIYPNVQKALHKRMVAISHPLWVDAMVKLIDGDDYFRWHDSGDLQSVEHLQLIVDICNRTPNTKHWLPTHETGIVKRFLKAGNTIPDNLVIRFSAAMINGKPPAAPAGVNTSTVHNGHHSYPGQECIAYKQDGQCLDCRACWDKSIDNISYLEH